MLATRLTCFSVQMLGATLFACVALVIFKLTNKAARKLVCKVSACLVMPNCKVHTCLGRNICTVHFAACFARCLQVGVHSRVTQSKSLAPQAPTTIPSAEPQPAQAVCTEEAVSHNTNALNLSQVSHQSCPRHTNTYVTTRKVRPQFLLTMCVPLIDVQMPESCKTALSQDDKDFVYNPTPFGQVC